MLFKRAPWRLPIAVIVGWQLLVISVPITAIAFATEALPHGVGLWSWLAVAYNVVIAGVVGFYLWNRALTLLPAGAAAVGSLAVPVIGVLSGALLLNETIGWREWTALVLVVVAIAIVMGALPGLRRGR